MTGKTLSNSPVWPWQVGKNIAILIMQKKITQLWSLIRTGSLKRMALRFRFLYDMVFLSTLS